MHFFTKKCNHGEKGRCINCLTQQLKEQKKQNNQNTMKQKCVHPPNMKCLKCMDASKMKQSLIGPCRHPSHEQCSKCKEKHQPVFDMKFEQYIQKLGNDCKHKKPCKKCVPPLSRKTFLIDKQCRNHLPYPQAQCDSCMPPTISLSKQHYTHVQKVICKTTAIYKVSDTDFFGVLVGTRKKDTIYIEDVYFPKQQEKGLHYLSPESLTRYQQILTFFGYEQLGLIYSSSHITSMDLMLSSIFQEYFSLINQRGYQYSEFVTMRLNNDEINPYFECFMVSDQFQALHKHKLVFEKCVQSASFDLVTAKRGGMNSASLPTFLQDGVQTEEFPFELIIVWLKTEYEQNFFIDKNKLEYPFFSIENQKIENIEILMSQERVDLIEKYRNLQFILHLDQLIGREWVILFLSNLIYQDPDGFLREKLKLFKDSNKGSGDSMIKKYSYLS